MWSAHTSRSCQKQPQQPQQPQQPPVPQGRNQVVEVLQKIDTSPVEQVIAVPKISLDRIPQRSAVRRPQKAEQLVEVPTIMSFSSLQQQTAEQIIDIPVPGRGGVRGEQGGLQGFSSGQNSTARIVEQNVDIPVPAGGLHDLPHPGASSSSAISREERGQGFFFCTVPRKKKSAKSVATPSPIVPATGGLCGSAGRGRVLRVQWCPVQAGLGPGAPVILLVHR